jgi:putative intracellular protease/amidase
MKKLIFLLILLPAIAFSQETLKKADKVLLFIRDGSGKNLEFMLTKEVGTMRGILEQSGFDVIIATISGEVIKADSTTIKPHIKLGEVDVDDYAGFIIPCMASDSIHQDAVVFVKKVVNKDKPIAAQLGSVVLLGKAGVLNGKKYAFPKNDIDNPDMYPELKSGIYSGNGVVQDGNIITSGMCPMMEKLRGQKDGTIELTQKLIQKIKAGT